MNFLEDYWLYHQCYEIPRNYAIWSGLGLLGSIIHRKVFYVHGDLEMFPSTYIGLIGPQGSSKSTCCSFARDFFKEACPDMQIGPSRASPESICKTMSDTGFSKRFTNSRGEEIEVRPLAFFINEFKNFVGRSPFDMLTFLTDIYDVKGYDATTIARGLEYIVNPAVNLLCCETPEWIVKNIKSDIISGGFGRRIVYVFETDDVIDRPVPFITPEARQAIDRCKQRLIDLKATVGRVHWSAEGRRDYDAWYYDNARERRSEPNAMMKGYLRTKHVQLFKVMMLLDASSDSPKLEFTPALFEEALNYLNHLEVNMARLSEAAGRNELLGPQQKIMEFLEKRADWAEEGEVKRMIQTDLAPQETYNVLRHLEETRQVIKRMIDWPDKTTSPGYVTPKVYANIHKNGESDTRATGQNPDSQ